MNKKISIILSFLILSLSAMAQMSSKNKKDYGKSFVIDHVTYMIGSWNDLNKKNVEKKECENASVLGPNETERATITSLHIKSEVQLDNHVLPVNMIINKAFKDCKALTDVTIDENIILIGFSAFENCTSLTSITLPKSIEVAINDIFKGCTALRSITIQSINPPRIVNQKGFETFSGIDKDCIIIVPKQSKEKYLNDKDWASLNLVFKDMK